MQKPAIVLTVEPDGQTTATATAVVEGQVIVAQATHPDPAMAEQTASDGVTKQYGPKGPPY